VDDHENDDYIGDDTEIEIDDDYDPSELDDGFVWHPAAIDGFSVEFA
jgi:hypothetical protein